MPFNGKSLLEAGPIRDMIQTKESLHGFSYGLSEIGYDIRIKQDISWTPPNPRLYTELVQQGGTRHPNYQGKLDVTFHGYTQVYDPDTDETVVSIGRTVLASSIEYFQIPDYLWCEFRNKSTHARRFCDFTIGTDGEPGWRGHLTIEGIFHGNKPLVIKAGSGILKAVFHEVKNPVTYDGKYQDQEDRPVPAIVQDRKATSF